jgi:hypothetical protein
MYNLRPIVPVTKTGKKDGTYMFGTRLLRAQIKNLSLGEIDGKLDMCTSLIGQVIVGTKKVPLEQFVRQYEKVESVKLRGMQSALPICTMMGARSTTIKI